MIMCAKCHKRVATVFVTKVENGERKTEGLCMKCAGELGMVGGQVLDMQSEERQCTAQEVLDIQNRKTGALIKASCLMGAIIGGADEDIQNKLELYYKALK